MSLEKVENIKRPLKVGEKFLVPCMELTLHGGVWDKDGKQVCDMVQMLPVINHPHNDIENGQSFDHYHIDFRFFDPSYKMEQGIKEYRMIFMSRVLPEMGDIIYYALPVKCVDQRHITPVDLIAKSKFKRTCLHKNKCPHRGYDLSQVLPDDEGNITCPLHGLKFDKHGMMLSNQFKEAL